MIAVLALLLVQVEAAMPPEVVVTAERLRRFRAKLRRDLHTGTLRCDVRRSSGLQAMDDALCNVSLVCSTTATSYPEAEACLKERMPAIMARYAPGNPPDGWSVERSRR